MPATEVHHSLVDSLLLPEPEAERAWHGWRSATDIDSLTWADQQLIAMLGGRVVRWTADDRWAGILQGIVRHTWTSEQVRLRLAARTSEILTGAGIAPVALTGPAAWPVSAVESGSVRATSTVRLLIPRSELSPAIDVLKAHGWLRTTPLPEKRALDFADHVSFRLGEQQQQYLELHWRTLPVVAWRAAAAEAATFAAARQVSLRGLSFLVPAPEHLLLELLAAPRFGDSIPREADLRHFDLSQIDWHAFARLASWCDVKTFRSLGKVFELAHLPVPQVLSRRIPFARERWQNWTDDYRNASLMRREPTSVAGFAKHVAGLWGVRRLWALPFAAGAKLLRYRRELLR